MSVRNFVSKNMVVIVMVPFLIGAHYGWMKLQSIESLVPAKERDNLPPSPLVLYASYDNDQTAEPILIKFGPVSSKYKLHRITRKLAACWSYFLKDVLSPPICTRPEWLGYIQIFKHKV